MNFASNAHGAPPPGQVQVTEVPAGSFIHASLPGAHFHDAYLVSDPAAHRNALQTWLDLVARTPRWTQGLMAARNRLVRLVGLKDLGQLHDQHPTQQGHLSMDASHYQVGDRVGIFVIRSLSETEVVMGQDDRHLNVQVALHKRTLGDQAPVVVVSTVVHVHNALGHVYMAVVKPFHRRIVRAMLRRLR
jgi:hypothetical protein